MTESEFSRYSFYWKFCQRMLSCAVLDAVNGTSKANCQSALDWIASQDTETCKDILGLQLTQVPFLVACDVVGEDPQWVRRLVEKRMAEGHSYSSTDTKNLLRNEHINEAILAKRYTAQQLADIFSMPTSTIYGRAELLGVKTLPASQGPDLTLLVRRAVWEKYPGAQIPANDRLGVNKKCSERILDRVRRHNEKNYTVSEKGVVEKTVPVATGGDSTVRCDKGGG